MKRGCLTKSQFAQISPVKHSKQSVLLAIFIDYLCSSSLVRQPLWCGKAIQIRTILFRDCFFCFVKGDGFDAFLVAEGDDDLVVVEIDCVDEGVDQYLAVRQLCHIQKVMNSALIFGVASFSQAMRLSISSLAASSSSRRALVDLVRIPC